MKLRFDTRFCELPATRWTFLLNYLPLSSTSASSKICSRWLPFNPADVRIFLHSCCTLLLMNNIISFVFLLSRNPTGLHTKGQYLQYLLIVLQTNSLLVQGYVSYQLSNYQQVAELVHLLPVCLSLLCIDTYYAIALNGTTLQETSNIFYRTVLFAFHVVAWLMLLLSLACAVQREYLDCNFIS